MKKKYLLTLCTLCLCIGLKSQNEPVKTSNYKLAERFSVEKMKKMTYSRDVNPVWLKDGNSFWYTYLTSEGLKYYYVDCLKQTKKELFDHVKLASELSVLTGDPLESRHLKLEELKFSDDGKSFDFEYLGLQEVDKKPSKAAQQEENEKKIKAEKANEKYEAPKPGKERKRFYFTYNIGSKKLEEKKDYEKVKKNPSWASVSPDGKTVIFSKNYNLYYMDADNLAKAVENEKDSTIIEYQITSDGKEGFAYGSGSEKLAEKDLKEFPTTRKPSYVVWSPDSKHFAITRTDRSGLKKLWVINSIGNPRPTLESYGYQMPGEKEAPETYLYVFDNSDKKASLIDISEYKNQTLSIARAPYKQASIYNKYTPAVWLGSNDCFYISRTSRDHKRQDMSRVNIIDGSISLISKTEMNVSLEERGIYMLAGGKEHIVRSERDGWAHFYLYDDMGNVKNQITKGEYHADELVGVDEKTRTLFFSSKGVNKEENPYYEHLCSIQLDGSNLSVLNKGDFNFTSRMNDNNTYFVSTYSRVDTVPESALYNKSGKKILSLERADLSTLMASGYKFPERFKVKAADGITDLYGVMYKPFDFDSTKLYPIIEYVYPGPQTEAVNESFSTGLTRTDQLAQLGFIVVTVGNRGGHSVRSKWYHTYGYGNLRDYGLADKKRAVEQLAARHNFIDISKVGIHGHSGGGFMSTAAMLVYPDFFKVAVSCAGNHDNTIYNRWWSEKHHGVKETVNEKNDTTFIYKIATNPEAAKNLKGKLLLVHGEIDDNVHPANTMRVANALIKANKRFDMIILPTQRHSFGDMNEYFFWRMADYFSEHLIGDSKISETHIPELSE